MYGEPIDLSEFAGRASDELALFEARERVEKAIHRLIERGMLARERDGEPSFARRLLTSL